MSIGYINKFQPEWILRIFLGLMFFYSGFDIVVHPTAWVWAVRELPGFMALLIEQTVGTVTYLRFQGASELLLAFTLVAWFLPRKITIIAAAVATLEMFAITILVGLDAVTFRDIGLIGAGWALFVILAQREKVVSSQSPYQDYGGQGSNLESVPTDASSELKQENDDVIVEVMKH